MCLICDRIEMIKNGTNPYFVKEIQTGYVPYDEELEKMRTVLLAEFNSIL